MSEWYSKRQWFAENEVPLEVIVVGTLVFRGFQKVVDEMECSKGVNYPFSGSILV